MCCRGFYAALMSGTTYELTVAAMPYGSGIPFNDCWCGSDIRPCSNVSVLGQSAHVQLSVPQLMGPSSIIHVFSLRQGLLCGSARKQRLIYHANRRASLFCLHALCSRRVIGWSNIEGS